MTGEYNVPARTGDALLEAKGSRFYGRAIHAPGKAAVEALLAEARARHPEAHHHAFAYRLGADGAVARFSDDGEPGGTAGRPLMEVLLRTSLVYAAIVVSRHFGGTLLGAGGLVRAYGGASAAAVRAAGVRTLRPHTRLYVTISYPVLGAIEQDMRHLGLPAPEVEYGAEVTLSLLVPVEQLDHVIHRISDLSAGQATISTAQTIYL